MEESRKQFECYAANKLGLPLQMIIEARKGDRYDHSFDSMNVMQPLTVWWTLWADSRSAIEIELPPTTEVHPLGPSTAKMFCELHKNTVAECAKAIRAAGLTVKGER